MIYAVGIAKLINMLFNVGYLDRSVKRMIQKHIFLQGSYWLTIDCTSLLLSSTCCLMIPMCSKKRFSMLTFIVLEMKLTEDSVTDVQ